jgi:hypothetical protein
MRAGLQRRLATGTNAVLVALFVVATTVLVVDLAARFRERVDLSSDGVATLQQDTLAALAAVDAHDGIVEVIGTSHQRRRAEAAWKDRRVRDLLRELELESPTIVTTWVDLDRERQLAEALEITNYGTLVVRAGDQRVDFREREVFQRVRADGGDGPDLDFRGEALVARGLQQVLSGRTRVIYVLSGHGEPALDDAGPEGLGRFAEVMDRQGWDVESLDLLRDRDDAGEVAIPDDADAVLLIAPDTDLDPSETQVLRAFVRRGGSLGAWVEPGRPSLDILAELGVTIPEGVAYDRPSLVPFDDWWVPAYGRHPIVEPLAEEDIKVVFAHGAAVRTTAIDGITPTVLLRSSRRGWLERVPERPPADLDAGIDEPGPVDVAVALELAPSAPPVDVAARALVVGDATGLGSELMDRLGNPTFAVNTVRWLVRDDRMTLVGRPTRLRQIAASPEALTRIGWLVIGVWPLLVVLAGGIVLWMRRGR